MAASAVCDHMCVQVKVPFSYELRCVSHRRFNELTKQWHERLVLWRSGKVLEYVAELWDDDAFDGSYVVCSRRADG